MIKVSGVYENGLVKLDRDYVSDNPVRVIVTFLENIQVRSEKYVTLSDFSFAKSQKNLENYTGSFSDAVIEERRAEL